MRNLLRHPATRAEIVDCLRREAEAASGKPEGELASGDMTGYLLRKAADIIENLPEHVGDLREQAAQAGRLRAALKPFSDFAAGNVDGCGWISPSPMLDEPISSRFGPHEFLSAHAAYNNVPSTEDWAWLNDAPAGKEQV